MRWRDEVMDYGRPMIRDDADVVAASLVTWKHVDMFIAEVWGLAVSGDRWNGFKLTRIGSRESLVSRLLAALRHRVGDLGNSGGRGGGG
jgi:hypothetical protein